MIIDDKELTEIEQRLLKTIEGNGLALHKFMEWLKLNNSKPANCNIFDVSQQRELLIAFLKKVKGVKIPNQDSIIEMMVYKYT